MSKIEKNDEISYWEFFTPGFEPENITNRFFTPQNIDIEIFKNDQT